MIFTGKYSLTKALNGALAGMVSLCAGCNLLPPWTSFIVASLAGIVYVLLSIIIQLFRIDDPLDAIAVHGGGGIVGILALPVFMDGGLLYGYSNEAMDMLKVNAYGAGVLSTYNFVAGLLLFGTLRMAGRLRIDKETERLGSDKMKHGEESYPLENKVQVFVTPPT